MILLKREARNLASILMSTCSSEIGRYESGYQGSLPSLGITIN